MGTGTSAILLAAERVGGTGTCARGNSRSGEDAATQAVGCLGWGICGGRRVPASWVPPSWAVPCQQRRGLGGIRHQVFLEHSRTALGSAMHRGSRSSRRKVPVLHLPLVGTWRGPGSSWVWWRGQQGSGTPCGGGSGRAAGTQIMNFGEQSQLTASQATCCSWYLRLPREPPACASPQVPGSRQIFSFPLQLIQEGRWKPSRVPCSAGSIPSEAPMGLPRREASQGGDPDVFPHPRTDAGSILGIP